MRPPPPRSTLFPYTTLFRSEGRRELRVRTGVEGRHTPQPAPRGRSEEHTSELQSRSDLVCRLLLEKKKGSSVPTNSDLYTTEGQESRQTNREHPGLTTRRSM